MALRFLLGVFVGCLHGRLTYAGDLRRHPVGGTSHVLPVCVPVRLGLITAFNSEVIGLRSYKKYFKLIFHTEVSDFCKSIQPRICLFKDQRCATRDFLPL